MAAIAFLMVLLTRLIPFSRVLRGPSASGRGAVKTTAPQVIEKFFTKPFPNVEVMCIMRGPPRRGWPSGQLNGVGTARRSGSRGVDGHEICCKMCGTLGHFGDESERGAEAGSKEL